MNVRSSPPRQWRLGLVLIAAGLAGCANASSNGDPGAKPLPAGQSCQNLKAELDRMVNKGIQGAAKAESDRYNQLLGLYLGARCHVT